MEIVIGLIIAILGGAAWFFKGKADKASVDAKLAETKGQDKQLEATQQEVEQVISTIDEGIRKAREEREAQKIKDENMTLKERADRIKKGLS